MIEYESSIERYFNKPLVNAAKAKEFSTINKTQALECITRLGAIASEKRQLIYKILSFGMYEVLGYDSISELIEELLPISRQEAYKENSRAQVELIFFHGDFSKIGTVRASHLDWLISYAKGKCKNIDELMAFYNGVWSLVTKSKAYDPKTVKKDDFVDAAEEYLGLTGENSIVAGSATASAKTERKANESPSRIGQKSNLSLLECLSSKGCEQYSEAQFELIQQRLLEWLSEERKIDIAQELMAHILGNELLSLNLLLSKFKTSVTREQYKAHIKKAITTPSRAHMQSVA
ncbi:MAG: hypothetical protein AXW14_12550 [Alteromonas sp. Nap_26]|nr:MAG: hypothetical protein AXW14_12550 [Alteromonas sp. Nap_26]